VLFCAELPSDSFPSRAKRSDSEAGRMALPEPIQAAAPPPKALATRTACRKGLSPRSPALGRAHHECALPRQTGQDPISESATFACPADAWPRIDDEELGHSAAATLSPLVSGVEMAAAGPTSTSADGALRRTFGGTGPRPGREEGL
jgi:hypothetical protein